MEVKTQMVVKDCFVAEFTPQGGAPRNDVVSKLILTGLCRKVT